MAQDSRLFVATGSTVSVVEVGAPSGPAVIAVSTSTGDGIESLAVHGYHLYAAGTSGGLTIFRIDGTRAPELVGRTTTTVPGQALLVVNKSLYVAGDSVVEAFDLSDPTQLGSAWHLQFLPQRSQVYALQHADGYLYAASDQGLAIVDVRSSSGPPWVANLILDGEYRSISIAGKYAFVVMAKTAGGANGAGVHTKFILTALHIDVPEDVSVARSVELDEAPDDVVAIGTGVFVVFTGKLTAYDAADPYRIAEVVTTPLTWSNRNGPGRTSFTMGRLWITVNGAASSEGGAPGHYGTKAGVVGVDITSPMSSHQDREGLWENFGNVARIRAFADRLILVDRDSNSLAVAEVLAGGTPRILARVMADSVFYDAAVSGDRLVLLDGRVVRAFRILGDDRLELIARATIGPLPSRVFLLGDLILVTAREDGPIGTDLIAMRVQDGSFVQLGRLQVSPSSGCATDLVGHRVFAVCGARTIAVLRIGTAGTIELEATDPMYPFNGMDVVAAGTLVYVAAYFSTPVEEQSLSPMPIYAGLQVVDIGTPGEMRILGDYRTRIELSRVASGARLAIASMPGLAMLGLGEPVLRVVDTEDPRSPRLVQTEAVGTDIRALAVAGNYLFVAGADDGLDVFARNESVPWTPTPPSTSGTSRVYLPLTVARR